MVCTETPPGSSVRSKDRMVQMETFFRAHQQWMARALDEARRAAASGEVPVGAVLVHPDGRVFADHNRAEQFGSALEHAEMRVIRRALAVTRARWLDEWVLYVTLEPCAMCAGAITLTRIPLVVIAVRDPKTGAAGTAVDVLGNPRLPHRPVLVWGVGAREAQDLLQTFFQRLRMPSDTLPSE